ncbi:MAG TPA: ABC transporter ATP-binding protein [Pyrinomonadaceae bacterium]|nr:ABC transporter ATP-binding protein [Pyrinomonadaceae bacterium]
MLTIRGLTKTYHGGVQALKHIDLEVPSGMFGLLGPNGSGKTTLMKILATLLEPDSGSAVMDQVDVIADKDATRRMLGYLPQEFGLYPTLTAEQTLDYLARLKGVWQKRERSLLVQALLERVNLLSERKQKVGGFSGGMRQRLGIAQALIGDPKLIIVDEPTAGLDPEERVRFHNLLSENVGEGVVVILSTHIVSDVLSLCRHMAIIRHGRILTACEPQRAIAELENSVWEATISPERVSDLKRAHHVVSSQMFRGMSRVRVITKTRPAEEFSLVAPALEDFYLSHVTANYNDHARPVS